MKHTKWKEYIEDIKSGRIASGSPIKKAVERFEEFCQREDMYLDKDCLDNAIDFIALMKHFLGKSAGKPFILEPFQEFILANLIALKWKDTGFRVCRETYIQVARKCGKDAFVAALNLYFLVVDGEAAPEIVCAANSTDQARILFKYITEFAKSIDPNKDVIKHYRNYLSVPSNKGIIKVISSDASKADGLNVGPSFCIDEFHEAKDRKMYDVLKSSQGMREQPMSIIITTAGFHLDGPCHDMYMYAIEVLNKIKDDPTFFPFIYQLDDGDDWEDPKNWVKVQPNLGVTVTEEFMRNEVLKAKNDATARNGVLVKTFNMWQQSYTTWIEPEIVVKCMKPVNLQDYAGQYCIVGCDLSTVSDFTSLSVFIPPTTERDYIFKSWTYLPEDTYKEHPNKELYRKFIEEGTMILTQGNVVNYDYLLKEINEINKICPIQAIYLDKWNATQFQITTTEAGFNVQEFSQSVGNYNQCTKEFERIVREGKAVIDKSANILFQMNNVFLKYDINGNCKPSKEQNNKKIDSVISMTTALGGWLKSGGVIEDWNIFII